MHAHTYTYIRMHAYTHAHTLEGTLMWTQVVHVHTLHVCAVQTTETTNKQVVRPYKCMSSTDQTTTTPQGCASYKTRNGNGKINKTKQYNHILDLVATHKQVAHHPPGVHGILLSHSCRVFVLVEI